MFILSGQFVLSETNYISVCKYTTDSGASMDCAGFTMHKGPHGWLGKNRDLTIVGLVSSWQIVRHQ